MAPCLDVRDLAVIADGLDMVRIMLGLRPQHCCHTLGQDLKMPLCKLPTVRQRPIGIGAGKVVTWHVAFSAIKELSGGIFCTIGTFNRGQAWREGEWWMGSQGKVLEDGEHMGE